ncbi:MAG: glycosyltransferase family 2 protein, partial [Pseudomonadota bacterium]|nr:glycosyltransferase family 2 protein [Pseudomonadota bacterium]
YILYPAAVILLQKLVADKHIRFIRNPGYNPTVSFIIAAYNEERVIERKIQNTLLLDYPEDKLQIIVVSDGSSDKTPEIAGKYASKGVISMHDPRRAGKSAALNRACEQANGEILIFSDANNDYEKNAIRLLVRHFADDRVGAVTGCKHIYTNADRQSAKGDGLYWKYESRIKSAESHLGSITAAEGEILAVRHSLFTPIPSGYINDDAAITFNIVKKGYRVLYDIDAKAYEEASKDLMEDFHVKVRMATGGYQTMASEFFYLFPPRSLFAFSFLSHKVLRWLTAHFMILILLSSFALSTMPLVRLFLFFQLAFYTLAFYGWMRRSNPSLPSIVYIIMYFTSMNLAMFVGFIKFILGKRSVNWRKAER